MGSVARVVASWAVLACTLVVYVAANDVSTATRPTAICFGEQLVYSFDLAADAAHVGYVYNPKTYYYLTLVPSNTPLGQSISLDSIQAMYLASTASGSVYFQTAALNPTVAYSVGYCEADAWFPSVRNKNVKCSHLVAMLLKPTADPMCMVKHGTSLTDFALKVPLKFPNIYMSMVLDSVHVPQAAVIVKVDGKSVTPSSQAARFTLEVETFEDIQATVSLVSGEPTLGPPAVCVVDVTIPYIASQATLASISISTKQDKPDKIKVNVLPADALMKITKFTFGAGCKGGWFTAISSAQSWMPGTLENLLKGIIQGKIDTALHSLAGRVAQDACFQRILYVPYSRPQFSVALLAHISPQDGQVMLDVVSPSLNDIMTPRAAGEMAAKVTVGATGSGDISYSQLDRVVSVLVQGHRLALDGVMSRYLNQPELKDRLYQDLNRINGLVHALTSTFADPQYHTFKLVDETGGAVNPFWSYSPKPITKADRLKAWAISDNPATVTPNPSFSFTRIHDPTAECERIQLSAQMETIKRMPILDAERKVILKAYQDHLADEDGDVYLSGDDDTTDDDFMDFSRPSSSTLRQPSSPDDDNDPNIIFDVNDDVFADATSEPWITDPDFKDLPSRAPSRSSSSSSSSGPSSSLSARPSISITPTPSSSGGSLLSPRGGSGSSSGSGSPKRKKGEKEKVLLEIEAKEREQEEVAARVRMQEALRTEKPGTEGKEEETPRKQKKGLLGHLHLPIHLSDLHHKKEKREKSGEPKTPSSDKDPANKGKSEKKSGGEDDRSRLLPRRTSRKSSDSSTTSDPDGKDKDRSSGSTSRRSSSTKEKLKLVGKGLPSLLLRGTGNLLSTTARVLGDVSENLLVDGVHATGLESFRVTAFDGFQIGEGEKAYYLKQLDIAQFNLVMQLARTPEGLDLTVATSDQAGIDLLIRLSNQPPTGDAHHHTDKVSARVRLESSTELVKAQITRAKDNTLHYTVVAADINSQGRLSVDMSSKHVGRNIIAKAVEFGAEIGEKVIRDMISKLLQNYAYDMLGFALGDSCVMTNYMEPMFAEESPESILLLVMKHDLPTDTVSLRVSALHTFDKSLAAILPSGVGMEFDAQYGKFVALKKNLIVHSIRLTLTPLFPEISSPSSSLPSPSSSSPSLVIDDKAEGKEQQVQAQVQGDKEKEKKKKKGAAVVRPELAEALPKVLFTLPSTLTAISDSLPLRSATSHAHAIFTLMTSSTQRARDFWTKARSNHKHHHSGLSGEVPVTRGFAFLRRQCRRDGWRENYYAIQNEITAMSAGDRKPDPALLKERQLQREFAVARLAFNDVRLTMMGRIETLNKGHVQQQLQDVDKDVERVNAELKEAKTLRDQRKKDAGEAETVKQLEEQKKKGKHGAEKKALKEAIKELETSIKRAKSEAAKYDEVALAKDQELQRLMREQADLRRQISELKDRLEHHNYPAPEQRDAYGIGTPPQLVKPRMQKKAEKESRRAMH